MNDRLTELRAKGGGGTGSMPSDSVGIDMTNLHGGPAAAAATGAAGSTQPQFMNEFFTDVEATKEDINAIKEAIRRMNTIHQEAFLATTGPKEAKLSHELNAVIQETNPKAARAKDMLSQMKDETTKLRQDTRCNPSQLRIRDNLTNTLTRKFVDVMKDYQNAQTKYKAFIKNKVQRQVQIVKPDASPEEIEAVFKSGGGADEVITQAILKGANESIRSVYQNVADKYQDVLTLEASIAELHQMFLDFALLVEQQGELLDQIEYQVKGAANYVEDGTLQVQGAIESAKKARKYQCCMLVCVMVLVGILVLVLFVFRKQVGV
ncbi:epimorphin family [Nannochloropsis oceanica]